MVSPPAGKITTTVYESAIANCHTGIRIGPHISQDQSIPGIDDTIRPNKDTPSITLLVLHQNLYTRVDDCVFPNPINQAEAIFVYMSQFNNPSWSIILNSALARALWPMGVGWHLSGNKRYNDGSLSRISFLCIRCDISPLHAPQRGSCSNLPRIASPHHQS